MSVLFIDTNCELWHETAKQLGLTNVIKMPYTMDGHEYFYDLGEHYDAKDFFNKIRSGSFPITSCLNAENYREYFQPYFEKGEDILYISFSDKMSATFNSLDMAIKDLKEKFPAARFRRFDTKGISMGAGLSVYAAGKLYKEGKSFDEIIAFLNDFIYKVNAVFTPDDLFFLKKGGRISAAKATLATILQIKPIIRLTKEGVLDTNEKVKGRINSIFYIADDVINNYSRDGEYPIVIMNADCRNDALKIEQRIRAALPDVTIWQYDVGPVIGTHCGPNTLAVCYVGKTRDR